MGVDGAVLTAFYGSVMASVMNTDHNLSPLDVDLSGGLPRT